MPARSKGKEVEIIADGTNRVTFLLPKGSKVHMKGKRATVPLDRFIALLRGPETPEVVGQGCGCDTWEEKVCNIPVK